MVYNIYSNIQIYIYIYIYYPNIIYQALFLKLKTQPPSRRARYYSYELDMVWTSFIWYGGTVDCWNLNWTKIICLTADMAANSAPPNIKYNACGLPIHPEKRESPYFCEVVCQPLREKDWVRRRRTDGSERQRRRRKWEAVTAMGAVGDGATGSEWECESERELDWEWEGETESEREETM